MSILSYIVVEGKPCNIKFRMKVGVEVGLTIITNKRKGDPFLSSEMRVITYIYSDYVEVGLTKSVSIG